MYHVENDDDDEYLNVLHLHHRPVGPVSVVVRSFLDLEDFLI